MDASDAMLVAGRITGPERERIRVEADALGARLEAGERWWSPWEGWRPGDPCPAPRVVAGDRGLRRG